MDIFIKPTLLNLIKSIDLNMETAVVLIEYLLNIKEIIALYQRKDIVSLHVLII